MAKHPILGSPEDPEPQYPEEPRQSDTSVEPMRDEDDDFPPVNMRQGRDFRSRLALNLLSGSVGAGYAPGKRLCSVRHGCPHGVVRGEGDTRLASLVTPLSWRLSCWLAGWGREGPRGGSVLAAHAGPGIRTDTPVPLKAESDDCGGAAGPTSGKR